MKIGTWTTVFLTTLFVSLSGSLLNAQQVPAEPSPGAIATRIRAEGAIGDAVRVLTQQDRPHSRHVLDEIADTLAMIVVSSTPTQRGGLRPITVLVLAGRGEAGTPYSGAAIRLLKIAENAVDGGARAAALSGMVYLPDRAEVVNALRQVATSQNRVAHVAVGLLGRETGAEGLSVLQCLHSEGSVTEPMAQRELRAIARYRGWQ